MARAATTSDVFNAIAEPQRRVILGKLAAREWPVLDLARELGAAQPGVSKHLRVLREVGLVRVRVAGRQRLYRLDARGLRPVYEWAGGFERFWTEAFGRLDAYVQSMKDRIAAMAASGPAGEREIVVSREVLAPRELVFEAFTEVRHLAQWWGPTGFSATTRAFEFSAGGVWEFVLHGPDGTDYPNWITWREIVPPERISLLHGAAADDPEAFESTITFTDRGDVTEVVLRSVFPSRELRDRAVREYHAVEGARQTLGRLAGYVADAAEKGRVR